jgi:hypothetical protein
VTPLTIFTIGHSTRPIDEFIRLLKAHGVQRVVDVSDDATLTPQSAIQSRPAVSGSAPQEDSL